MTLRLYYDDPYRILFGATVIERLEWLGRPAVILDETAFYPTGGGQPHDRGALDGIRVLDVLEPEDNEPVVHVLEAPLAQDQVEGRVDWARRFDLMQQHTGQHLLSAASLELLGAATVGFHLSDEYATIDLDRAPLGASDLARVEDLVNTVVYENRQVTARFVPDEELAWLPLRKPVTHAGPVRIVQVQGFDCSACGGTHVRATGEVGLLKIVRNERRGAETRIEFLCGRRALRDYAEKTNLLADLAAEYTVGHREVPALVHRLSAELQQVRRELRDTGDTLRDAEAEALWLQAEQACGARVVAANLPDRSPEALKYLALRLVERPGTVALLGSVLQAGGKGHFAFARSADLAPHMGDLVRRACELVGGRGGGRSDLAQGGGPDGSRVPEAIEAAGRALAEILR